MSIEVRCCIIGRRVRGVCWKEEGYLERELVEFREIRI